MIVHIRTGLSDSAFADPKGRRFPIIDVPHVRSAMQCVMGALLNRPENVERDTSYLRMVHDNILKKAEELHMNLGHEWCELCNIKVKFD